LSLPGSLEFALDPRHPELLDDVVAWSCGRMESDALGVTCMRSDEVSRASLSRMGFKERPAARTSLDLHRLLREVQPGVSPAGTRVRHVEVLSTPEDLAARVAAHRAAFHPSRVTEESYRNVASTWPYLASLDVVVENDAGEVLAYCLGWYDEKNKVGEFEPVGCVPSARRTGAASAACHEVLVRLKVLGADRAVVYPPDDETNRGPEMLYRSLGFEDNDRTVKYVGTWRGRPVDG
jgi:hypothetical protein